MAGGRVIGGVDGALRTKATTVGGVEPGSERGGETFT
jgi:hypothetical protein